MGGLEHLQRKLARKAQVLRELNGKQLRATELFTNEFVRSVTPYTSFEQLTKDAGIESPDRVDQAKLDDLLRRKTRFRSFDEFRSKALEALIESKCR